MRWSVEVTRVGTSEVLDELCLEAAHWQQALKRAREIRGEGASLEGLSVDALDEGCRAIDAASALRFEVTRVADDAPLIESSSQGSRPASKDEASEDSAGLVFASIHWRSEGFHGGHGTGRRGYAPVHDGRFTRRRATCDLAGRRAAVDGVRGEGEGCPARANVRCRGA
jgi:hypothetical protein